MMGSIIKKNISTNLKMKLFSFIKQGTLLDYRIKPRFRIIEDELMNPVRRLFYSRNRFRYFRLILRIPNVTLNIYFL